MHSTGGFISGEIKLAINLRLLDGGAYLYLGLLHVCGHSSICRTFYHVVEHWTCNNDVVIIALYDQLNDVEGMKNAAKLFSKNGRNLCMFGGVIGVLNGWLVKTKCPTTKRDGTLNFGSFSAERGVMPSTYRPLLIVIKS